MKINTTSRDLYSFQSNNEPHVIKQISIDTQASIDKWSNKAAGRDVGVAASRLKDACARNESSCDLSGLELRDLPDNINACQIAVRGTPACCSLLSEQALDEIIELEKFTPFSSTNKILAGEKITRAFNEKNEPLLVSTFTGKVGIYDFDFSKLQEANSKRQKTFHEGGSGLSNFSASVLFKSCKDILFGSTPSNAGNKNLLNYKKDLLQELNNTQDPHEREDLNDQLTELETLLQSKKVDKLTFGAVISPDSIKVQNAFPNMHSTNNLRHDIIKIMDSKAFSGGGTGVEDGVFRDKHFQVHSNSVSERSTTREDMLALKKHIEKGRLTDAVLREKPNANSELSEILFLPRDGYADSILAAFIDFSSNFENMTPHEINQYLMNNTHQTTTVLDKFSNWPVICIYNTPNGERAITQIFMSQGLPFVANPDILMPI
ncbi:hypothetical protein [Pseudomonas entomophila]|uniref:hypothetical protein n=1 Tax=Pseudomonas entomophila TaxID=312306 RepID=UPI001F005C32|nr:hypothetical protein [Pseudomonas entomophila]MCG8294244.1 hypothetical protein [Pseudomonas entomophila]